jgi:CRP-like cAMP-binding protein
VIRATEGFAMVKVQELKEVILFRDVPESVLELLAEIAEEVHFAAGEPIADEEEPAPALYLIRLGTVRGSGEGLDTPVVFGAGESFGEVSILDGGPIGLTLIASERVDAIALRPARLAEKFAGNHEAGHAFYRVAARSLAGRLRRTVGAHALASHRS